MLQIPRQIWRFRGLTATLVGRELAARYRGSVLGFFWSLINPLLLTAVYTVVFGIILPPPRAEGLEPYAVFLVAGLFPWLWLSNSWLEGAQSLVGNAGLIKKAVFPAELLPVVVVVSHLIHFLLALPIVVIALGVARAFGYPVGGWGSLVLPLIILLQLPLVAGGALALSALSVHFKDVRDILANLLTLLFFTTPIIYPLSVVPVAALRKLIQLNPLSPYTLAYQEALFWGRLPSPSLWLAMAVVSSAAWFVGTWLFERLRETVVEAV